MYEAGARWRRPGYFPKNNENFQEAVNRECTAVRSSVGVYDGSPLGKFELKGKNVGETIRFQHADGYAEYMVFSMKPLKLIHLNVGDAWDSPYAELLTPKKVDEMI